MSAAIEHTRTNYYGALKAVTAGEDLDLTGWNRWFVDRLGRAIASAMATLDNVLFKADFWQTHGALDLNARQTKVLNRLLDGGFEGKLTTTKWAKLTKASQDTATRDIADLVARGLLRKGEAGGRSTAYEIGPPQTGTLSQVRAAPIIGQREPDSAKLRAMLDAADARAAEIQADPKQLVFLEKAAADARAELAQPPTPRRPSSDSPEPDPAPDSGCEPGV